METTSPEIPWSKLYSKYWRLVDLARSLGGSQDAEDIVSSVLLRVAVRRRDDLVTWSYLARAVKNETIDRHRQMLRRLELLAKTVERPRDSVEDEAIASAEVERWEGIVFLRVADRTAAMIQMRIDGASWREIAHEFCEPIPTVQARVRRALIRVRRLMEAETKHA